MGNLGNLDSSKEIQPEYQGNTLLNASYQSLMWQNCRSQSIWIAGFTTCLISKVYHYINILCNGWNVCIQNPICFIWAGGFPRGLSNGQDLKVFSLIPSAMSGCFRQTFQLVLAMVIEHLVCLVEQKMYIITYIKLLAVLGIYKVVFSPRSNSSDIWAFIPGKGQIWWYGETSTRLPFPLTRMTSCVFP